MHALIYVAKAKVHYLRESEIAIFMRREKLIRFVHATNFQTYHRAAKFLVRSCYVIAQFVLKVKEIVLT